MSDDRAALEQVFQASRPDAPHVVLHYLYFPARNAAEEAAAELRSLGFEIEERLGADSMNWLVLARHEVVPTEDTIAAARKTMENLARARNGEYDGWEVDVPYSAKSHPKGTL